MDVNALRRSCPLFRGISEEDLTAMLGCLSAREISPRRGDFIMRTPEDSLVFMEELKNIINS